MKSFLNLRESTVKSADRKPEKYTKPDGRVGVRMVPVDKEVVKTESKEIDEISLTHLTKKIADSGGMKQVAKANKADKLKKDLEAMKKRMATEQMDDEDDDENECPHCDMEDGEHEKDCPMMQEKTLTPAEKKKREEIAKAMERENPGMDMSKKMAIATAAAKRVAEEVKLDEVLDTPKAMDSYRNKAKYSKDRAANSAAAKMLRNPKGFHSTDTSDELKTMDKRTKGLKMADKAAGRKTRAMLMKKEEVELDEVSKKTLANYIKKASDDRAQNAYQVGKTGEMNFKGLKRRQGINRAAQKLAKEEVELDEGIEKMSHSRLKWHMNTGVPHGSYSKDEMKAERDRRMQHRDSADAYKKTKPSMSEEAKPDAVEVMRKKQQMASISTSDKDKLAKIRAMLNKEKKK